MAADRNWNRIINNPSFLAVESVFQLSFEKPVTDQDLDAINDLFDAHGHGRKFVVEGLTNDTGIKEGEYLTARVTCIGS